MRCSAPRTTLGNLKACLFQVVPGEDGEIDGARGDFLPVPASQSLVPGEEVLEGAVVVLVEGRVDQGVEERVGVAEPQEDALPGGGDVTGAQGADELRGEEGDPAEHKHPNEDAHH